MPTTSARNESILAHFNDGKLMHFSREETVIHGFDEPKGIYLIKKGFVKSYSVSKSGQENMMFIHGAGEIIPMPWALDGNNKTGLSYEAMSDTTILRAPKDKLRVAMGSNPWLSQEMLKQAVNTITLYTKRIQTLEFRSTRDRICSQLLYLSERFGEKHGKEILINAPITHQDIADSINMTRETASRALEILFKEGIIEQVDHTFNIIDLGRLQKSLE